MCAAGPTSSSFEMASKGGSGVELELDKVPCREHGMTPFEMMLPESQQRMLMVLQPGKVDLARGIFEKWDLAFPIIGRLTDSGRLVLHMRAAVLGDLPLAPPPPTSPPYNPPWSTTPPPPAADTPPFP